MPEPVISRSNLLSSVELRAPQFVDAFVHKRANPARHQAALCIDDLDRYRLGLEFLKHVLQASALAVGRDHVGQKHSKTESVDARVNGAVDIVRCHDTVDRDSDFPATNPEMPLAAGYEAQMPHAQMLAYIVGRLGHAVLAQISLAHTTRRTRPTGIATIEESRRCAIRIATSMPSSIRLTTRSTNRISAVILGWRSRNSYRIGAR